VAIFKPSQLAAAAARQPFSGAKPQAQENRIANPPENCAVATIETDKAKIHNHSEKER
jgi:hypothetical protein